MQKTWKDLRQEEKAVKDEAKRLRRIDLEAKLTPDELQAYDAGHQEFKQNQINKKRNAKNLSNERLLNAPFLAIDLAYDSLMTLSEQKSLKLQMFISYSFSLKSLAPCRLQILNYNDELYHLSKIEGFQNWNAEVNTFSLEEAITAFDGKSNPYVYLSGDADTEIEEFDESKIYVIGGLVDRNRYKKAALNRAEALGIPSVKLNLKQFAKMKSSQIIAVNHIFEMMTKLHESGSLRQAVLESLPDRKIEEVIGEE